jgi:two-component system NtrC family sensor kinase
MSPSTGELWGLSAEDLYQGWSKFREILHVEDLERTEAEIHLSWKTGELDVEFRVTLEDGSERWIANRGFPIRDESGYLYRMGGFLEDITDRKEADHRLAESERLASIGELSAGVAHEINNPLTSIVLYSQMLLEEDIPESIRNDLQVVSSQAYRAAKIVRNLLQFARKSDPEKRPLSIGWLIRRSLEMKSHEFSINSITVADDIPDDLPLIMMDEHLILQVLLNVLTNAEQACASAHGRGNITVSASTDGSLVDVSIHDDGPGISTEELAKIFQPFFTTKET